MVTEMGQSPQGVSFLATADWLTNLLLPPRCYLCVPIPARMLRAQSAAWDRVSRDEMETSSYYERQQRKYGRSRRGSTSYHGALELLLSQTAGQRSEEDKVRGGSPHTVPFCALTHSQAQLPCEHAPTSGLAPACAAVLGPHGYVCAALSLGCVCGQSEVMDETLEDVHQAIVAARAGDVEDLCNLAVDLAVRLKSLQKERLVGRGGRVVGGSRGVGHRGCGGVALSMARTSVF